MISVETLLNKLRRTLKDEEVINYSDDELMDYIEAGIAFIRRIIISENPEYIARPIMSGELVPGENSVELPASCYVYDLRVDGKKIPRENLVNIKDINATGDIRKYVLLGGKEVLFFPIPQKEQKFQVMGVLDQPRVTLNSNTPFNSDMDNLVFEYAVLRAGMGEEFQMSQETQLMQVVTTQVEHLLNIYNQCEQGQVQGYY